MKKVFFNTIIFVFASVFVLSSCKKDKEEDTDDSTEQSTSGADANRYSSETDAVIAEGDDLYSASSLAGAKVSSFTICGATVDSSTISSDKKITLNFDNTTPCVNATRKRGGQIVFQLTTGTKWNDVGAVLTITFNNYKVTRISDGKSITLNGSKTVTNVNGGLVGNLTNGNSVVHLIQATGLSVTFDDGSTRTWNTDRTRTISKSAGQLIFTITGNASEGGFSNVAFWGVNRFGNIFYTTIDAPLIISSCSGYGDWKAISGVGTLKGLKIEVKITFGVNQDGSSNGTCNSYGYKINWTNIFGKAREAIVSY